jgi:hypothetical protein
VNRASTNYKTAKLQVCARHAKMINCGSSAALGRAAPSVGDIV